jgi:lipopolysaccharide export system permease protein
MKGQAIAAKGRSAWASGRIGVMRGHRSLMRAIDRYIFRTTFGTFLLVMISLTGIIWITHALRDIDLITNNGQTILVFMGITGMLIPALLLVIAPISLVIAVFYVLNKLNTDSELIVMNAAGMSPWRIFRPFLLVTLVISLIVAVISAYIAPKGIRELRSAIARVRADLVTNIVQPGRFYSIENGLTLQIRERTPGNQLLDVFVDDRRSPGERLTLLAEQGEILQNERGTFLLLNNGSLQRQEATQRDPTIVVFDRYAFDLSQFAGNSTQITKFGASEWYLWDLAVPDTEDPNYKASPGQFRAEFHDRLLSPIYPMAFAVIAFAILGAPKTTRQSQALALGLAIATVGTLRFLGFGAIVVAAKTPIVLLLLYASVIGVFAYSLVVISRGTMISMPQFNFQWVFALVERAQRWKAGAKVTL